jgi:release factor glutamine methyltransferase
MIVIVDNASMLLQNSLSEDANQATSQSILAEPSPVEKSARQAWLGACLQVGFSYFITHADKPIADDIVTKYREGIAKLEQGVPLAYVIGRQGFWRHEFKVNQYTLIPRPDTETLVETVLNLAKNRFNLAHSLRLLDLGTGSGCIAISLAAEQPNWQVTATDFSTQALAVAQHNAQQIGTANVEFYQGSWFQALPDDMPKFDIIVSNPPYIDSDDEHLPALTAEPITALVAANHGLADIEVIVQGSRVRLNAQGLLAIEHGYDQGDAVQQIFRQYSFTDVTTLKDFGGNDRVTYGFFN